MKPMNSPILELSRVNKTYGSHKAVDDVSFSMARGETVALLGASGSGKTTTLRMIAGFVEPDAGTIRIGGRDMAGIRPYERNIGLVFQDYALFPHMTVAQNIAYGLKQRRFAKEAIADKVESLFRLVRLQGFEKRRPADLSGGQQQRVALARAIAIEPALLLLDEPLSALDAKLRHELRFELKQILKETNCTSLIVTHDQEEAMSLADRVLVMHQGKLLQEGDPTAVYQSPTSRLVAEFIGRANWLEGCLGDIVAEGYREFKGPFGTVRVSAPNGGFDGAVQICIRPERLIVRPTSSDAADHNLLPGRLVNVAFLGKEIHYAIRLDSGLELVAVEPARDQQIPAIGAVVFALFRPGDAIVVPA